MGTSRGTNSKNHPSEIFDPKPLHYGLKFGVVIRNSTFQIYRSARLGEKGLQTLEALLREHELPFPKTIIHMNKLGYGFPFRYAIEEHCLSQSGFGGHRFDFFHPYEQPSTYIGGIDPTQFSPLDKKLYFFSREARAKFPLAQSSIENGESALITILNLILHPIRQPILFHCHSGRHRTGMIAMLLRYLEGGYWTQGPHRERYGLMLNPAQFEYYRFNHLFFRKENLDFCTRFMQNPSYTDLLAKLSERLRKSSVDDGSQNQQIWIPPEAG